MAAAAVFFVRRAGRGRLHAIDAIPGNAFLVLTVDVDGLRRSPLGSPIFGGISSKLAGEKALTDLCGFDPLARMTELAVAVPESGDKGDFGIAIKADISRDELLGCAGKVIESRKQRAMGAPTVRESGSYTLIEPDAPDSDPTHAFPTLAYRDGGPFLIARGVWLASMIDTVEGKLPSAKVNPAHATLRDDVTVDSGKVAPTVVATAVLPKAFRERMKAELGLEADPGEDTSERGVMSGVLGVSSVGLGIKAGPAGGDSDVVAVFRCEDNAGCAVVERLLAKRRLDWAGRIDLRLLGVGKLLDSMKMENQGTLLRVTARAPSDDASRWLDRLLTRPSRHPGAGPFLPPASHPGLPPGQAPTPDEVLQPRGTPQTPP